jgi:NitT/TauT family transport system substrate-binding protein
MQINLLRFGVALIIIVALEGTSSAATKIKLLYTASPPFLASFVAQDQGFFGKRGLDLELELVATGGTIVPAMVGGSAQIGGPTATVLLQANEAGLEVLALAAAEKFPTPYELGILAREGSNIRSGSDLAGKAIGVPGLNGVIDVMT